MLVRPGSVRYVKCDCIVPVGLLQRSFPAASARLLPAADAIRQAAAPPARYPSIFYSMLIILPLTTNICIRNRVFIALPLQVNINLRLH